MAWAWVVLKTLTWASLVNEDYTMVNIDENVITITKGDTLETKVSIFTCIEGECVEYVPGEGDSIRFALKSSYKDEEPLIIKEIPIDTMTLRLESADTKKLDARKKAYVYDVQLTTATGVVSTFIDRGSLYVTEEVD